jgi:uncharacterized protein (TIGR03083 family)
MDDVTRAFFEAADTYSQLLDQPGVAAKWQEPSTMEGYTIGGVVGHVNAAVSWLEPLLDRDAPSDMRPIRLGGYYSGMKVVSPDDTRHPLHTAVRDMSEKAARHGPTANADRFRSLIQRLDQGLSDEKGDRVLDMRPTLPAAVRLSDFLRTRVVELVVHGDDLAASVGIEPPRPSEEAARVVIDTLVSTARAAHGDLAVIRALSRRERSSPSVFPVL